MKSDEYGSSSCLREKGGGSISSSSDILTQYSHISVCYSNFPESRFFDHRLFCETLYFFLSLFQVNLVNMPGFHCELEHIDLTTFIYVVFLTFLERGTFKAMNWVFFAVIPRVFYASQYRGYS